VNITSSSKTILLDAVGRDGTSFNITVCAKYSGRGFSGRPLSKISKRLFVGLFNQVLLLVRDHSGVDVFFSYKMNCTEF